jgi:hypothetical protein
MDQQEFENLGESILDELKNQDGHSSVRNLKLWGENQSKFNSLKIILAQYGLVLISSDGSVLTLTQKGWEFKTFQDDRNQVEAEKQRRIEQSETIIATNKSIQETNKNTNEFYKKQDRYENTQKGLTWVIAIATFFYTLFAILSYLQSCHTK